MNFLTDRSKRSRLAIIALAALAGASLIWGRGFVGLADGQTTRKGLMTASIDRSAPAASQDSLELNEKQAGMVKVGAVGTREFAQLKTAVGTIDFNENMLVQVFSQYPGKILRAFFNIGDDVKLGDMLFTIDSPDLLQAESALLAAAGVLELQKKTLARPTGLLKAGGSAQKDVDQATSDEQTAEGNFKAAKDSVRIFGKSDAAEELLPPLQDRGKSRCDTPRHPWAG